MTGVLRAKVGGNWVDIVGGSPNAANPYNALGMIAYAYSTAAQVGIPVTQTLIQGLQVTFTPVVGRRYKTTMSVMVLAHAGATAQIPVAQITDATGVARQQRNTSAIAGDSYVHLFCEVFETFSTTAPVTRQGRASISSGTMDTIVDPALYPNFISVEDAGPVGINGLGPLPANSVIEASWVPVMTTSIAAGTFGNSTVDAKYQRIGQWCSWELFIAFGTTWSGGTGQMSFSAPFPTAQQTLFTSKLYIPSVGWDMPGVGYITASTMQPLFPPNLTSTAVQGLRNADGTSTPGTGIPQAPGVFPMAQPGSLLMSGRYRIAPGS